MQEMYSRISPAGWITTSCGGIISVWEGFALSKDPLHGGRHSQSRKRRNGRGSVAVSQGSVIHDILEPYGWPMPS